MKNKKCSSTCKWGPWVGSNVIQPDRRQLWLLWFPTPCSFNWTWPSTLFFCTPLAAGYLVACVLLAKILLLLTKKIMKAGSLAQLLVFFYLRTHPHLGAAQSNHSLNWTAHGRQVPCTGASQQGLRELDILHIDTYCKVIDGANDLLLWPLFHQCYLSVPSECYLADDGCCLESHTWRSHGSSQSSCSVSAPGRSKVRKRQGQRSQFNMRLKNLCWPQMILTKKIQIVSSFFWIIEDMVYLICIEL